MAEEGESHTFAKNLKWLINYDFDEKNFVRTNLDIKIISNGEPVQMTEELADKFEIEVELLNGEIETKEITYSGNLAVVNVDASGKISLLVIKFDGVELVRIVGHN